jgi:DsbC/DsbD-like thiol-disulfide interchange protein
LRAPRKGPLLSPAPHAVFAPIAIVCLISVAAPENPVKWRFAASPKGDGTVRVEIRSEVQPGWHIYATALPNDLGPVPTAIRFHESSAYVLQGPLLEPMAEEVFDPNFSMMVRYHDGSPVFSQMIKPTGPGDFIVVGEVEYMVCNDKTCLPPVVVPFSLTIESL